MPTAKKKVQPCEHCGEVRPIMARGWCSPCYQRHWSTGSFARKLMSNVGKTCSTAGCDEPAVSKGLCRSHYDHHWHPLRMTWHLMRGRYGATIPREWDESFEKFVADVGERPSPTSQLRRIDNDRPWSASNVRWLVPVSNDKSRLYQLKWRMRRIFGIEPEQYDRMLAEQGGGCGICGGKQDTNKKTGEPRNLAIDHCHTTKKVRGLLCVNCNRGLGYFSDDIGRLEAAIAYLKKHATKAA